MCSSDLTGCGLPSDGAGSRLWAAESFSAASAPVSKPGVTPGRIDASILHLFSAMRALHPAASSQTKKRPVSSSRDKAIANTPRYHSRCRSLTGPGPSPPAVTGRRYNVRHTSALTQPPANPAGGSAGGPKVIFPLRLRPPRTKRRLSSRLSERYSSFSTPNCSITALSYHVLPVCQPGTGPFPGKKSGRPRRAGRRDY